MSEPAVDFAQLMDKMPEMKLEQKLCQWFIVSFAIICVKCLKGKVEWKACIISDGHLEQQTCFLPALQSILFVFKIGLC